MFRRSVSVALATLLLAGAGTSAASAQIVSTLPEYNGDVHDPGSPFPLPPVTVGTFNYMIPVGATIVGATIFGTFGNSVVPNSSGVDVFLGSILVGQCVLGEACWSNNAPTPWSYTFSGAEFDDLIGGSISLFAVQTSEFVIRLGETTLTIDYRENGEVPEPVSLLLMGTGLAGVAVLRRRRRESVI